MSFNTVTILPFKKIVQLGVTHYICDIGSIRLFVDDVALLDNEPVAIVDPLYGMKVNYAYSLSLPAHMTITPVAGLENAYLLEADTNTILLNGNQYSGTPDSTGTINGVTTNLESSSSQRIIYDYSHRVASSIDGINHLQGIITTDTFDGGVPSTFTLSIEHTIINRYGKIIDSVGSLILGTPIPVYDPESGEENYLEGALMPIPCSPLFEAALRNSTLISSGVDGFTITRSTPATYLDRYGIVRHAEIDQPRFNKNGLIKEGKSTNYFVGSKNASVFTRVNCSEEIDKEYDASFETTVDIITNNVADTPWYVSKIIDTMVLTEGQYVTFSIRLKSATGISGDLKIRDTSGENADEIKSITLTDELTRYELTTYIDNATAGHPEVVFQPTTLTAGSDFACVDMQVEPLNFASSIIETIDTIVTREADHISIPYGENFPGSLADKTISIDISIIGTTDSSQYCFDSGDLKMLIGNGTPDNLSSKIRMSASAETGWIMNTDKFRFGMTYASTTKELKMFHNGIMVATTTNAIIADAPAANANSYDMFLTDVYPQLDSSSYDVAISQIFLDFLTSEIKFGSDNSYIVISNIRILDEALTEQQMLVF